MAPEEARHVIAAPPYAAQELAGLPHHGVVEPSGTARGLQVGILVDSAQAQALLQVVEETGAQVLRRRRPEADRIGDAISAHRGAVVGVARRQVEQVAPLERPLGCRAEAPQYLERCARLELEVALAAH